MARTNPFVIDTAFPTVSGVRRSVLFSPTADSALQSLTIHQTSSGEDLWTGQIQDASGAGCPHVHLEGQGDGLLLGREG